jgi:hypothetical protein
MKLCRKLFLSSPQIQMEFRAASDLLLCIQLAYYGDLSRNRRPSLLVLLEIPIVRLGRPKYRWALKAKVVPPYARRALG